MRRVIGLWIVLRITYRIRFFAFGNSRGQCGLTCHKTDMWAVRRKQHHWRNRSHARSCWRKSHDHDNNVIHHRRKMIHGHGSRGLEALETENNYLQ
jgi:hypothetical protein